MLSNKFLQASNPIFGRFDFFTSHRGRTYLGAFKVITTDQKPWLKFVEKNILWRKRRKMLYFWHYLTRLRETCKPFFLGVAIAPLGIIKCQIFLLNIADFYPIKNKWKTSTFKNHPYFKMEIVSWKWFNHYFLFFLIGSRYKMEY